MKLNFEIDEAELRNIIAAHISKNTGLDVPVDQIQIEVKSKQNYRSEWEAANFRATFRGNI